MDCSGVPPNRLAALARYGLASKALILAALAQPRRTATLLAMTRHLDAVAIDDALDLFALLMATKLSNRRGGRRPRNDSPRSRAWNGPPTP